MKALENLLFNKIPNNISICLTIWLNRVWPGKRISIDRNGANSPKSIGSIWGPIALFCSSSEGRLSDGRAVLYNTLMVLSIVCINAYVHINPTILQHAIFTTRACNIKQPYETLYYILERKWPYLRSLDRGQTDYDSKWCQWMRPD